MKLSRTFTALAATSVLTLIACSNAQETADEVAGSATEQAQRNKLRNDRRLSDGQRAEADQRPAEPAGLRIGEGDQPRLAARLVAGGVDRAVRGEADVYNMGWKRYLDARATDEQRRKRERANAEKKASALRAQAAKLGAKATKATAAQQMLKRADRMIDSLDEEQVADRTARIRFPEPAACGKTPLMASGLSKSYGSLEIFTGVDLAIDKGSRVVVLGLNGAGKTTLLKVLAGVEASDTGSLEPGYGLKIGYFAQEHDTLDDEASVWDNIRHASPDAGEQDLRGLLGAFMFSGPQLEQPTGTLSGGERTRLALAGLVSSAANVLLLDEPTNNLDPASREEILGALAHYEGAVVLVSHDSGAVQALNPERVLILPDGVEDIWGRDYVDLIELA